MVILPPTRVMSLRKEDGCIIIGFKEAKRLTLPIIEEVKLDLVPLFVYEYCKFIFDFTDINFIDSTGIGCLILLSKSSKRHKSQMKLCNIAPNVQEVLELLNIPMILDIEKDLKSCKENFND